MAGIAHGRGRAGKIIRRADFAANRTAARRPSHSRPRTRARHRRSAAHAWHHDREPDRNTVTAKGVPTPLPVVSIMTRAPFLGGADNDKQTWHNKVLIFTEGHYPEFPVTHRIY